MIIVSGSPATKTSQLVSYVGSNTSTTSTIAIPAHQAGDIIVVTAFRREIDVPTSIFAPSAGGTVPTWNALGWIWGFAPTGTWTVGFLGCYAVATGSNMTSGTWTNATNMAVNVFRGSGAVTECYRANWSTSQANSTASVQLAATSKDYANGTTFNNKMAVHCCSYANVTIGAPTGWILGSQTSYVTNYYLGGGGPQFTATAQSLSSATGTANIMYEVISYS